MNNWSRRLLVALAGLATTLATAAGMYALERETGFALYFFLFNFLPVGAALAGLLSTLGYFFGALLFHQKPAGGLALHMAFTAVLVFVLMYAFDYVTLEVDGNPLWNYVSFFEFVHHSIVTMEVNGDSGSSGELGVGWGYALALWEIAGFALGGLVPFAMLLGQPYCDTCSLYAGNARCVKRFTDDAENFPAQVRKFAELMDAGNYTGAITFHSVAMGRPQAKGATRYAELRVLNCDSCGRYHVLLLPKFHAKNRWNDINGARVEMWTPPHALDDPGLWENHA